MRRHASLWELLTHGESFPFGRVAVLIARVGHSGRHSLHMLTLLLWDEPSE